MSGADEQAREVEVRLVGEAIEDAAMRLKGRDLGTVHRDQIAREALAALEPIRAAEREEAAREGARAALYAAVDVLAPEGRMHQHLPSDKVRRKTYAAIVQRLRQWARHPELILGGVTGRSET